MNILLKLFLTFAKIGVCTFGGGYAMLPMFQRELVENNSWSTESELLEYYAISTCTPGVIAVNVATLTGYKVKGIRGAIAATLGVIFPSVFIIILIASLITGFAENQYVIHALAGIRITVCALVTGYIYKMLKNGVKDLLTLVIFSTVLIISLFLPVSPVYIVAGAALLGVILSFVRPIKKEDTDK